MIFMNIIPAMKLYGFFHLIHVGLTAQSTILAYLFLILEGGQVTVQLSPDLPAAQNVQFVQNFMLGLLKSAFPNLLE